MLADKSREKMDETRQEIRERKREQAEQKREYDEMHEKLKILEVDEQIVSSDLTRCAVC